MVKDECECTNWKILNPKSQIFDMNISELSLRRPVLAIVLNLIIVLFGLIGFKYLGVRDYPAIDPPNINVRTSYGGANPDIKPF